MSDLSMSPLYTSTSHSEANADFEKLESPRTLYAQSFDRPESARSLPTGRFHKNMKEITGFGMTEEEFDSLPIAIRRKVRGREVFLLFAGDCILHLQD
jgi:hypothetical protein